MYHHRYFPHNCSPSCLAVPPLPLGLPCHCLISPSISFCKMVSNFFLFLSVVVFVLSPSPIDLIHSHQRLGGLQSFFTTTPGYFPVHSFVTSLDSSSLRLSPPSLDLVCRRLTLSTTSRSAVELPDRTQYPFRSCRITPPTSSFNISPGLAFLLLNWWDQPNRSFL